MTLTCQWVKDRAGDRVMKWTQEPVPVLKLQTRRLIQESKVA
jgi:hypothetical protein